MPRWFQLRPLPVLMLAWASAARAQTAPDGAGASEPTEAVDEANAEADDEDVIAHADGPTRDASDDDLAVEDIVVTGTRTETTLGESPARVDVIRRADIERSGARDAAELLEEQPGVVITRSFRGDAIQLGGLDPEYTLILVDGDRVPGRLGGGIDLGRYTVENIERIEVLRGPGSALYGSDAIAGVVNILTRRSTRDLDLEGSVQGGYGGGAIVDATAAGGVRLGQLSLRADGGYHTSEAFRRSASDVATSGSARDQLTLGLRGNLDLGGGLELDARADYVSRSLSGVDVNAAGAVFDRVQLAEQVQTAVGVRYRGRDSTSFVARVSYSLFREQYLDDQRGSQALDDFQDNREHLAQVTLQADHTFGDHRLSAGYEVLAQLLDSDRLTSNGHRARISPFVQDEWTLVDERELQLSLVAGARYDIDSQYGDQLSPRIGLRFQPIAQLVTRATYGWGFRAPSFQELLLRFENPSVGYVVNGNPELGPERSRGLDVSVEWTPIRELVLTAIAYRNDLDDMITTVTVSDDPMHGTLFSYANIASAYTQGLEGRVALQPIRELRFLAGYALNDTWDEAAQRRLEARPLHRFTGSAQLDDRASGLGANVRTAVSLDRVVYVDGDGDGVDEAQGLPAVVQLDARVSWAFLEHFELSAGVDNLIDAGDAYLVLRPRTYWAGLRGRY